MIGWPSHFDPWDEPFAAARREVAAFANAILATAPRNGLPPTRVILVLEGEDAEEAARLAVPGAEIINTPCGDTWLRDTGPILTRHGARLLARSFRFNGWGEKYIYPGDEDLSDRLSDILGAAREHHNFVLEGGSVDWDGAGRILTTQECLINPNRNAHWTTKDAEQALKEAFGISEVIWVNVGLINDHTDGHIDNIARFVGPGHVVCQSPTGTDDPHTERLLEVDTTLRNWRGKDGHSLKVTTIPSPGRVLDEDGEIIPASHANFVITNQAVIIPGYNDQVEGAVRALAGLFPDRNVLASPSNAILTGGGSFHCISQQIPAITGEKVK